MGRSLPTAGLLGALGIAGSAVAQARHRRALARDAAAGTLRMPPGRSHQVVSADGTLLHAEVFGPDEGPAIVLAHGWVEALRLWVHVIRELSEFRIVAYDQRGHGASGRSPARDYSTAALAADFDAVLEALCPGKRPVVAGHSMGAMGIAAWAEDHDVSTRVAAVGLLNTGVSNLVADHALVRTPLDALLREPLARRFFMGSRAPIPPGSTPLHHLVARRIAFGPHSSPAAVDFLLGMAAQCREADRAAFGLAMADMDLLHALDRIDVPALVMAGGEDRLTPPTHAQRMAGALGPRAELVVVPNAGHMGPLECPHEVAAALRRLAARAGIGGTEPAALASAVGPS